MPKGRRDTGAGLPLGQLLSLLGKCRGSRGASAQPHCSLDLCRSRHVDRSPIDEQLPQASSVGRGLWLNN